VAQVNDAPAPAAGLADRRLIAGAAGAILLLFGSFLPVMSAPFVGSVTYFNNGSGDGVFTVILALLVAPLLWRGWYKLVAVAGLAALGLCIGEVVHLSHAIARANSTIFANAIQLQWGWAVLLLGGALLVVSPFLAGVGALKVDRRWLKVLGMGIGAITALAVISAGISLALNMKNQGQAASSSSSATPALSSSAVRSSARNLPTSTPQVVPTVIPTQAPVAAPAAALSSDQTAVEQAVLTFQQASRAAYGQGHDTSGLDTAALDPAKSAVQCLALGPATNPANPAAYTTRSNAQDQFQSVEVNGQTATAVEHRADTLTTSHADGTTSSVQDDYTATYTLTQDATGTWVVSDYSWSAADGSSGSATQDAQPCVSSGVAANPYAPAP
jgi:hypothetical protein